MACLFDGSLIREQDLIPVVRGSAESLPRPNLLCAFIWSHAVSSPSTKEGVASPEEEGKVRQVSGLFRPSHLEMDAQRDRATALSDVTEAAVAELVVSRQTDSCMDEGRTAVLGNA